ncbi:MAG: hypothetical protein HOV81_08320 [Kofleriaceae bacterium]|nr:hypothetical protein [Kofleriaceae bacterium]
MRFSTIGLLLLVACSGKQAAEPANPSSGSGSAPPPPSPPAVETATVTDGDGATANAGKLVDVKGTARDAKIGAAVVATSLVVYCLGHDRWPNDVFGKPVTAHGKLEQTTEFAAPDATTAGTSGAVWVLRDCTYQPSL